MLNKYIYLTYFSNMNESRRHTRWKKSDIERQILYDFTYIWNLKNKINNNKNSNSKTNWWIPEEKGVSG